ncbi:riboflavin biosynthesis protein RibF [Enterocloster citroniae]|uniref:riboflavin biosynthesis protein RibF n=1 Tax=Enterocloster citroniae TaxID=358743 RepID=UPI00189BBDD1|nr:riboflavin biosynthesis protein RibF [Enterocloster citroniae]
MRYIADTTEFQIEEPTIVTLGKFDGRHRGHQKLLRTMQELKSSLGYPTAIFTFGTPPLSMMSGQPQTVITTNLERRANMEKMGVDYLVEYPFSEETRRMKPEDFVKDILAGRMQAKVIVVGPDCSFGYKGAGDARLLKQLEETLGYRLHVIEKERDHLRDISSTYIREELEKGNVEKANALLGEPYAVHGEVVHGNHIGTSILGFPTANLLPPSIKRLPRFGVYVSRVLVDGTYYRGVTNIGRKPTVEGRNPVGVETYIFDMHQDLYGKVIEVQLLAFDRPEQKFSSLEELKQRIEMDKVFAADYFERHPEIQVKR